MITLKTRLEITEIQLDFTNIKCDLEPKVSKLDSNKVLDETNFDDENDKNDLDEATVPVADDQNTSDSNLQLLDIQDHREVLILPDVPKDSKRDVVEIFDSDLDDEIARRMDTQCFATTNSEVKSETEFEEIEAVTSTESDREEFNQCYYNRIGNLT